MSLNFGLIGVAGYIAPRHLKAIKDNNCQLIVATDPNTSVGTLDQYFPNTFFYPTIEQFNQHIYRYKNLDWISICSPNYLHCSHIEMALRSGTNVICEKPLVLDPWELDYLERLEEQTGKKVYTILQLRLSSNMIALKERLDLEKFHNVEIEYMTARGQWYSQSWKGNPILSGGVGTNIGIHLFDLMLWLFGIEFKSTIEINETNRMKGTLYSSRAKINWNLSIDRNSIPDKKDSYRIILIDGEPVEFGEGFKDLHTKSYTKILLGEGFGIKDTRSSIELAWKLRNNNIT